MAPRPLHPIETAPIAWVAEAARTVGEPAPLKAPEARSANRSVGAADTGMRPIRGKRTAKAKRSTLARKATRALKYGGAL